VENSSTKNEGFNHLTDEPAKFGDERQICGTEQPITSAKKAFALMGKEKVICRANGEMDEYWLFNSNFIFKYQREQFRA
jgi:hypothetical protein